MLALLTLLAAFAPGVSGAHAWAVPGSLLVIAGAAAVVQMRSLPRAAFPLVAYGAVYVLLGVRDGWHGGDDPARYVLRPLLAVAVASLPLSERAPRRLLLLIVGLGVVEACVATVQAASLVVRHGRHATSYADSVTGTLGAGQAGVLGLFALFAAAITVAWWLRGGRSGISAVVVASLLLAGVVTSTRAAAFIVPVVAVATSIALLWSGVPRVLPRRVILVGVMGLALGPGLYGSIAGLYSGAFQSGVAAQDAPVLGSSPAGPGGPLRTEPEHIRRRRRRVGVELLPGRLAQLRLALRLSVHGGAGVFLFGRGFGSSELDPAWRTPKSVPLPQRTGSTWVGRVLTEAGWLGLAAFGALLAWLAVLAVSLGRAPGARSDGVLSAALLPLILLTVAGAVDTTILDVRAYSLPFWLVVGLAARSLAAA